jgi:hypothetical protein
MRRITTLFWGDCPAWQVAVVKHDLFYLQIAT